jgi:hypothetical protein
MLLSFHPSAGPGIMGQEVEVVDGGRCAHRDSRPSSSPPPVPCGRHTCTAAGWEAFSRSAPGASAETVAVVPKLLGRRLKPTAFMRGLMAGGEVPISYNIRSKTGFFGKN